MIESHSGAWPDGRRLALSVNVMLEQWSDGVAPGIGPMGNPLKPGVIDTQARSWAAYGPKAGAWRLLDVLAAEDVEAVFYCNGIVAERHPGLIRAISDAGHAVAAHGWAQDILPVYQTVQDEADDHDRTGAAFAAAGAPAPGGFLSPRCTPSADTSRLLAERGYRWHADFFDADLPVRLPPPAAPLIAMPFTMEINDLPLVIKHGAEPETFLHILARTLERADRLTRTPACLDITAHAHLFGRPGGALVFQDAIRLAKRYADTTCLTNHLRLAEITSPRT